MSIARLDRALAPVVRPRNASVGRRSIGSERGGQMPVAWWVVGAAISVLTAWAMANTLLRWVTLD